MSSGLGAILPVAGFLIERNCAIYVAIHSVASVHSVEGLGVVRA